MAINNCKYVVCVGSSKIDKWFVPIRFIGSSFPLNLSPNSFFFLSWTLIPFFPFLDSSFLSPLPRFFLAPAICRPFPPKLLVHLPFSKTTSLSLLYGIRTLSLTPTSSPFNSFSPSRILQPFMKSFCADYSLADSFRPTSSSCFP